MRRRFPLALRGRDELVREADLALLAAKRLHQAATIFTPEMAAVVAAPADADEHVGAAGLAVEARWVRHHHERVDGRGYPDRLNGDDIPLESRIILVADAFEAMTSDRPYRRAPGREFAVQELRRGAGTQFDAAVVDALCRTLATAGPVVAAI